MSREQTLISTQYELSGQVLEQVKDAKYLGVTVSDDLEWTKHINATTTKANSKLSFLRRNLKGCPEKLRETAYFALVRPFTTKCCDLSDDDYSALLSLSSDFSNLCNGCLQNELPNNLNSSVGEVLVDLNHDDDLNSTTNDLCELFQRKGLHFIHVNARSLLSRVSEIRVLANRTYAAVICVTETWFDSSVTDAEVEIPGYLIQRRDRSRSGGGVCIRVGVKYSTCTCT